MMRTHHRHNHANTLIEQSESVSQYYHSGLNTNTGAYTPHIYTCNTHTYLSHMHTREQVIERKWHNLVQKLDACRSTLSHYHDLMSVFAEMDDCLADMAQTEVRSLLICKTTLSTH